jgi:hypothetical protein
MFLSASTTFARAAIGHSGPLAPAARSSVAYATNAAQPAAKIGLKLGMLGLRVLKAVPGRCDPAICIGSAPSSTIAEIWCFEQFYTDADARSAQAHQYRALPRHQPPTKSARRTPPVSLVGVCLVCVCVEPRIAGLYHFGRHLAASQGCAGATGFVAQVAAGTLDPIMAGPGVRGYFVSRSALLSRTGGGRADGGLGGHSTGVPRDAAGVGERGRDRLIRRPGRPDRLVPSTE